MSIGNGFDPDFAAASDWAKLYRAAGIQVVPCRDKRPLLKKWKEYQDALVPQPQFDAWYGAQGAYVSHYDMGMLTGAASGRILMIDLDFYKAGGDAAKQWWGGVLMTHNHGMTLETWQQRTGGGGIQLFFSYPPGWKFAVNAKTNINVDIRCQGGFAVLPPTLHASGTNYVWEAGLAPWDLEILAAPDWLLEEVEKLVAAHGHVSRETSNGHDGHAQNAQNAQNAQYDSFGHQTDGRETFMRDLVWGAVVDWYRECPIKPGDGESVAKSNEKYRVYEAQVSVRGAYQAGTPKAAALDAEGRGPAEFARKWHYAMGLWDTKVAEEANKPGSKRENRGGFDYTDEFKADPKNVGPDGQSLPLVLTDVEFIKDFKPPKYLVNGIIQKGYLYSLTGPTGHGKTPISMLMGCRVARGLDFHGKRVAQGSVLFLAGENADDIRARYIAMANHEGFEPGSIPFYFIDGVINIQAEMPRIVAAAELIPNLSLVIIDTDQAYFLGDEGNSNEQRKWFAQLLRHLLKLPGNPAALVNCHPTKNATQDNLVPIGGSSFLNEVDGNITCWTEDRTCVIKSHSSKWRGQEFESLAFELRTITCDRLKDEDGQSMPSVIAVPITEEGAQRRAAVSEEDDKVVLRLIHAERDASLASVARNAGWFWPDGSPSKTKVQRIVDRLVKGKLLRKIHGGKYRLTKAGCGVVGLKFERYDDDDE